VTQSATAWVHRAVPSTPAKHCKSGPDWVHEIKHDGYRLIARRTGDRVRLYTRRGFNWADRYPRVVHDQRAL
jgi:bifunctional non-homologous end joining protein LigD